MGWGRIRCGQQNFKMVEKVSELRNFLGGAIFSTDDLISNDFSPFFPTLCSAFSEILSTPTKTNVT